MKKGFAPPPKGGSCLRAAGRLFLNGEEAVHSRTLQVVRKPVAAMNSPGSVIWPTRMSWQLADTIVAVGTNALETQTNYFLNHWVPNLRGAPLDKKRTEFGSEPFAAARVIIVDPRRTVTVNACEVEAGKVRVMHLAINSGTDLALFNAWLTYINEKGLTDKAFVCASSKDFDKAAAGNKTSLEEAAQITGLSISSASQPRIAQPKQGGVRRRTMFAYEKGLIWGNDNYRTNAALVNVALATGNIGRPGGGCGRMGGHQEGYSRPSDAHVGRPAAYVDQLLIEGKGGVHLLVGSALPKKTRW
jgi:arsenite oxidase large subunit